GEDFRPIRDHPQGRGRERPRSCDRRRHGEGARWVGRGRRREGGRRLFSRVHAGRCGGGSVSKQTGAKILVVDDDRPHGELLAVDKSLNERALRCELASLRKATAAPGKLVAKSSAMREVLGVVDQVAPMDVSVLITGPSGVGKELVARALHESSHRAGGPFV